MPWQLQSQYTNGGYQYNRPKSNSGNQPKIQSSWRRAQGYAYGSPY